MKILTILLVVATVVLFSVQSSSIPQPRKFITSADRIRSYNYPVQEYSVQTSDGYILGMFRIPYSPKLNNQAAKKPVIFLQHGLLSSSDCWLLNGPDNALAYLLADAGYDVWMGNARGNNYSRANAKISPFWPEFWNFSWNEIGLYDLPCMIDFVLYKTGEDALHYVGHSQGTTSFFVMLGNIPRYNDKIKTSHMLAPVGYMEHMESPLAAVCGPLLGNPSLLSLLIGSNEFLPTNDFVAMMGSALCADKSLFQPICSNTLFLIAGYDSEYLNYTLLPEVMETHPAGSSTSQLIHYLQEKESSYFRKYDYGILFNDRHYKQNFPPKYLIENIRPEEPIQFYYSDNDLFASVTDVMRLYWDLEKYVKMYHVPIRVWTHLDYLWAINVKEIIYDRVLRIAHEYEERHKQ